jgi:hypothetical protein
MHPIVFGCEKNPSGTKCRLRIMLISGLATAAVETEKKVGHSRDPD